MKKLMITTALTLAGIAAVACAPGERPTDRVKSGCIFGDLVYETRDGSMTIVENAPECAQN